MNRQMMNLKGVSGSLGETLTHLVLAVWVCVGLVACHKEGPADN